MCSISRKREREREESGSVERTARSVHVPLPCVLGDDDERIFLPRDTLTSSRSSWRCFALEGARRPRSGMRAPACAIPRKDGSDGIGGLLSDRTERRMRMAGERSSFRGLFLSSFLSRIFSSVNNRTIAPPSTDLWSQSCYNLFSLYFQEFHISPTNVYRNC